MNWVNLDSKTILNETIERSKGRATNLSPFDVPTAAGVELKDGILTIVFQYIGGTERTERLQLNGGLFFHVGKSSRRLYRIEVLGSNLNHSEPESSLKLGIEEFINEQKINSRSEGSYRAAKSVLNSRTLNFSAASVLSH